MTWREKNIALGLAALLVLIVWAYINFGSELSGATAAATVASKPAPPAIPHNPAGPEPVGAYSSERD